MQRGAVKKTKSKMLTTWVPKDLIGLLDKGVVKLDTDRAKFIRSAIREKLSRSGITLQEAA